MDARKSQTRAGKRAGNGAGELAGAELERAGTETAVDAGTETARADVGTGAGESSRPLGDVAAGVAVDVDRPALLEEAAAIAASSSDAPPATSSSSSTELAIAVDVQAKAADVAPAIRLLVSNCCGTFAPNWEVTKAEGDGVADAAALVAAYWMPDGVLEPKYLALLTLAMSLYGLAGARRLPDGSWVPLRKPREPASSSPAPSPASSPTPPLKLV